MRLPGRLQIAVSVMIFGTLIGQEYSSQATEFTANQSARSVNAVMSDDDAAQTYHVYKATDDNNTARLFNQAKQVITEVKRLGSLFEDKKFNRIKKSELLQLQLDLSLLFDGTDLNSPQLNFYKLGGLHYTERYGVVEAFKKHFSPEDAGKFDTYINLLHAISVTFETDFYGFSPILTEAINQKHRDFDSYQRMIELMAIHAGGCSLDGGYDLGPERHQPGLCVAFIARSGFASSGQFYEALEWARESYRYLKMGNHSDPAITAPIKFDLAKLEFSHGNQKEGKELITGLSEKEMRLLQKDEESATELASLLAKARQQNIRQPAVLNPGPDEVKAYFSEYIGSEQTVDIEKAAVLLRLLQKNQLPKQMVQPIRNRLHNNLAKYNVNPSGLSANARLDLGLLIGNETGVVSIALGEGRTFSSFLFDRNPKSKRRKAQEIYREIFDSYYAQFADEVGFFKNISKLANAMEIIGYPSAAHETRLQVLENLERGYGDDADQHKIKVALVQEFLDLHSSLAHSLAAGKNKKTALRHLDEIIKITRDAFADEWKSGSQDIGVTIDRLQPYLRKALNTWNILASANSGIKTAKINGKIFETIQLLQLGDVALSAQAGARKTILANDERSRLLSNYEDVIAQISHLENITSSYRHREADGFNKSLNGLRALAKHSARNVREVLPFIEAYTDVAPVKLENIQDQLHEDEALVMIVPAGKNNFAFVADNRRTRFYKIDLPSEQLAKSINELRLGLDPNQINLGDFSTFDAELSYNIYRAVFNGAENLLADNRQILFVAAGPLTSIPLGVLVREDPAGTTRFDEMKWMAKSHAVTNIVSVTGLAASRTNPVIPGGEERKPLIGFGDPIFDFKNKSPKDNQRARRQFAKLSRGIETDLALLAKAPPLPETEDELRLVAKSLEADQQAILLRQSASETVLKGLSKQGNLSQYNIVYFATHGLVAGELNGANEPGLVLSVPEQASLVDDGFLSSSEIAQLKLNADWVVLSACNTAAPGKPGADALSGMAKSFFKAGSRSVLASHWPVVSSAAVILTTGTFEKLSNLPNLSRAEALRRTMIEILDESDNIAKKHPAYWAPFVLVSNG